MPFGEISWRSMHKNQEAKVKTFIIAETDKHVDWGIKYFRDRNVSDFALNIIPISPESQVRLISLGYSYDHYIKLQPNRKQKEKFLQLSQDFSNRLIKDPYVNDQLRIPKISITHFLTTHWLNFLPLLLNSQLVIDNLISRYNPKQIIYFKKNFDLSQSFLGAPLESLILNLTPGSVSKKGIKLLKIDLGIAQEFRILELFGVSNLKKYLDILKEEPLNFFRIIHAVFLKPKHNRLDKKSILIFADRHIMVDAIPLLKKIHLSGKKVSVIGAYIFLSHKINLIKHNISFFNYHDQSINKSSLEVNGLVKSWKDLKVSRHYNDVLADSRLVHVKSLITLKLDFFFRKNVKEMVINYLRASEIVKRVKPKTILLFSNYGLISLSFCYAAKQVGAKIIILQHGIIPTPKTIYTDVFDRILVWGKIEKIIHQKFLKIPERKLSIVGWHYIDPLIKKIKQGKNRLVNYSDLSKLNIIYVTTIETFNHSVQVKTIFELIDSLSKFSGVTLTIRPHPGQIFPRQIATMKDNRSVKIKWDYGKDLDKQINNSDIVISQTTTVGLRAMLWHKPVIHLVPNGCIDIADFSKYGAAIKLTNARKVHEVVKLLMKDSKLRKSMQTGQRKLLTDYAYKLDGKTCDRILKFL